MTTHLDQENERFSRSALESAASQLDTSYIPIGFEHDPRLPPFGRVVAARVVDRLDGEAELWGLMEFFEPNETIPLTDDGKAVPLSDDPVGFVGLSVDRDLREALREEIAGIERLVRLPITSEIKKGAGGPDVVTLLATFTLGTIAGGFLQALGTDVYESTKRAISRLFRKRSERERLFMVAVTAETGDRRVSLEVTLTNPDPGEVPRMLDLATSQLDAECSRILSANPALSRIAFEMVDERLRVKFAVRRDAVPIFPRH